MELKLFCILILGIFACNKVNQWKQPLQLCFALDIEASTAAQSLIEIQSASLHMEAFNFDANRQEGADVYFTKQYPDAPIVLFDAPCSNTLTFEIPQGTYADVQMRIDTEQNDSEGLLVEAVFLYNNKQIPVSLALSKLNAIELTATSPSGQSNDLNMDNKSSVDAVISLNLYMLFNNINNQMLEEAISINTNSEEQIIINANNNVDLYNQILANSTFGQQIAILNI